MSWRQWFEPKHRVMFEQVDEVIEYWKVHGIGSAPSKGWSWEQGPWETRA